MTRPGPAQPGEPTISVPKALPLRRNAFFALGVGLVIVLLAVGWGVWNNSQLAGKTRIEGTVVTSPDSDGESGVVSFIAADGRRYRAEITSWSVFHSYWSGDTVAVAYDPADPTDARVADFHETFGGPVIIGGFGSLFVLAGAWAFVSARRGRRLTAWLTDHGRELFVPVHAVRVQEGGHGFRSKETLSYTLEAACTDPATGRPFTAKSASYEQHPGHYLATREHLRVLYDPADPTRNLLL